LGFLQWLSKFESTPAGERIPVFLISAEGGGIRAAYWTARVMAELDERSNGEFSRHAFVVSGVSGGSVGVTAFVGATLSLRGDPRGRTERLERFFGQDYLSPMVARMLITEPIWQLLGRGVTPRDVGFERQFESDWQATFGNDLYSRPFLNAFSLASSTGRARVHDQLDERGAGQARCLLQPRAHAGERCVRALLLGARAARDAGRPHRL
jgi:hypothetical protein